LAVQHATAQTPKSKFDSKAKNLGIAFLTVPEIGTFTDCVDDSFYDEKTMDEISDKSLSCGLNSVPASKYPTVLDIKSKMDKCLKPGNQDTMGLINKVLAPTKNALKKVYDAIIAEVRKRKAEKLGKQGVLNNGYTVATAATTKPLIETVCKKLYDKITKLEWDCFKKHTTSLINFSQYNCSTWTK
ncbi:hypothetical protein OESDEN_08297, partial [Oesophagostomum dentatum]